MSNSRISKRPHQACDNCRRKKTRCPGEKPSCSMCTRLQQVCRYGKGYEGSERLGDRVLEDRLEQLEQRMDMVVGNSMAYPRPPTPSSSAHELSRSYHEERDDTILGEIISGTKPPMEIAREGLALYHQYCHMQPLWLFDEEEIACPDNCPEEVILAILALALRFSKQRRFAERMDLICDKYAESARNHITLQIARGEVQLSTIQSLCLLALANFVANDTRLAWLHVGLATNLCTCGGLDAESHRRVLTAALLETRRKVFWSVHMLNKIYGSRNMQLNMLDEIHSPRYVGIELDKSKELGISPPMVPQREEPASAASDIWVYMVQLSTLWDEVQHYISHCASGSSKPPWSLNSGYSAISSQLMDMETKFPSRHRYDSVRFMERSKEQLHRDRVYWGSWLFIQFTYHAVHSMLNHPFLYSWRSQLSAQLAVPNTFWKTSSEIALIHTTWITRLVDMVSEKEYRVSDPFLGHCVTIAVTIHIYFCKAADGAVREAAQARLSTCMRFLGELAHTWPRCRVTHERLEALLSSASATKSSSSEQHRPRRTLSINTSLMWNILDHTSPSASEAASGGKLFHPSFFQAANRTEADDDDETVETEVFHNPNRALNAVDGGQEWPPYSNAAPKRAVARNQRHWSPPSDSGNQIPALSTPEGAACPETMTAADKDLMDMTYDPFFQFQNYSGLYAGMWDIGNSSF